MIDYLGIIGNRALFDQLIHFGPFTVIKNKEPTPPRSPSPVTAEAGELLLLGLSSTQVREGECTRM